MSASPITRRFRFRLQTLVWPALVIALAVFAVREHRQRARLERRLRELRRQAAVDDQVHKHRVYTLSSLTERQQHTIDRYKRRLSIGS
jgi:hypothetical protein